MGDFAYAKTSDGMILLEYRPTALGVAGTWFCVRARIILYIGEGRWLAYDPSTQAARSRQG
jgi:hypothetical protein